MWRQTDRDWNLKIWFVEETIFAGFSKIEILEYGSGTFFFLHCSRFYFFHTFLQLQVLEPDYFFPVVDSGCRQFWRVAGIHFISWACRGTGIRPCFRWTWGYRFPGRVVPFFDWPTSSMRRSSSSPFFCCGDLRHGCRPFHPLQLSFRTGCFRRMRARSFAFASAPYKRGLLILISVRQPCLDACLPRFPLTVMRGHTWSLNRWLYLCQ